MRYGFGFSMLVGVSRNFGLSICVGGFGFLVLVMVVV